MISKIYLALTPRLNDAVALILDFNPRFREGRLRGSNLDSIFRRNDADADG